MAPPTIPGVNIPFLTGPLALGYMFGYLLYGMSVVQLFFYHVHYPKDHIGIKATVWAAFILDTVVIALFGAAAWSAFGTSWGDVDTLFVLDRTWLPLPMLNELLAVLVQSFFAWRIWKLTHKPWLSTFIACMSLLQCFFAFYFNIRADMMGATFPALLALSKYITLWLSFSAATDIIITSTIVIILMRASMKSSIKRTATMLANIVKFTIETGLLTSIWAIIHLSLWLTQYQYNFHFMFLLTVGRLYTNWLLGTLNSRAYFTTAQPFIEMSQFRSHTALWSDLPNVGSTSQPPSGIVHQLARVHITTTKETRREADIESSLATTKVDMEG